MTKFVSYKDSNLVLILRTDMKKLKRLNLPRFFYYGELDPIESIIEEEGDHWREVTPVVKVDGWYYDRIIRFSWYEYQGRAWTTNNKISEQFIYELDQLSIKWLSDIEINAIKTLMVYHSCPKELKTLLWKHQNNRNTRDLARDTQIFCRKLYES